MYWLQALGAAVLCASSLTVGSWIAPKWGYRSAWITAFVLCTVLSVICVGYVLFNGVKGLPS
jgi:hypothetical protein